MQYDTYITLRSQRTKGKKMTDKETCIHDKMYELQAKKNYSIRLYAGIVLYIFTSI